MAVILTWLVFGWTYVGLAIGKVPGLRTDRAGIALIGAAAMLAFQLTSVEDAVRTISFDTIGLLLGMMILVAHLDLGGFFKRAIHLAERWVRTPHALLAATLLLSGVLSALLVNDIVCLALPPLVLHLARRLGYHPVPHLLAVATASNIGSVATIIGNPQNMIIGIESGVTFGRFSARLTPIALLGLAIDFILIAWIYRRTLSRQAVPTFRPQARKTSPRKPRDRLLAQSVGVAAVTVALFFTDLPKATVALSAAALLLLGRIRPRKIYSRVDWPLLVMFASLFVVVGVFNREVVGGWGLESWPLLGESPVLGLSLVSAALSNLVSNVPAVLLFRAPINALPLEMQETAWLALAMSSTLAGNLTILGSVANLIVVEEARREGIAISLGEYCRLGVPLTVATLVVGIAWLAWVPY